MTPGRIYRDQIRIQDETMEWKKEIPIVHLQVVKDSVVPYGALKLDAPERAARAIWEFLGDVDREHLISCCVDNSMAPTYIQVAGIGTMNACLISVPEIFKTAILSNASGLLLFHTHPSGVAKPSAEDIAVTRKIREAGKMLDIPLHDHIIIGASGNYFSFRESDLWDAA